MTHTPVIADPRHRFQVILQGSFIKPEHADAYEKMRQPPGKPEHDGRVQIFHSHISLVDIAKGIVKELLNSSVEYYPDPAHPDDGKSVPGLPDEQTPVRIDRVIHFHQFEPDTSYPGGMAYLMYGDADDVFIDHFITRAPSFHSVAKLKTRPDFFSSFDGPPLKVTVPGKRIRDVSPKQVRRAAFVDNAFHLFWLLPPGAGPGQAFGSAQAARRLGADLPCVSGRRKNREDRDRALSPLRYPTAQLRSLHPGRELTDPAPNARISAEGDIMPITGQGWEVLIQRLGLHVSGAKKRTYSTYQVFIDGQPAADLTGHMCECIGPGNRVEDSGKRIKQGRYPLWTQFGRYRTIGYSTNTEIAGKNPMPAILLRGTRPRTGILIHPGHPPNLFLSSIGCLNPTNPLASTELMNFWDSRSRTIALIDSLKSFDPRAFQHDDSSTRIGNAWAVIDGEPMNLLRAPDRRALAAEARPAEPASLPISKAGALKCARWLVDNFGPQLAEAARGKAYRVKHLCAIVCQETAYKWLKWTDRHDVETIIARCVLDASGDYPGTRRTAFPVSTAAFRARYDDQLTQMLIEEANKTRRMQGWSDREWVYKGYGIFQYDLQKVRRDETFFRDRLWYSFATCLDRCCKELDEKLVATRGNLWRAIRAYNGSGPAAGEYAANVRVFTGYCAEVTGD